MTNPFARVVVTGGGGMLAHAIGRALTARQIPFVPLNHMACDIARETDVHRLFFDHHPTLIFNCAAYTKVDQAEQEPGLADAVNGYAVGTLAQLSRENGTMLVHFSTDFVFDGKSDRPYQPDDPVNPLSTYGRSKLLGERELQEHAPDRWLIVRTAWLYGPNGSCFPNSILRAARAGKPLSVVDDQVGSPTFTHDLAEATLHLIDRGAQGIWHIVNSGRTTWHGFATALLEEFSLQAPVARISSEVWKKNHPTSTRRPAYSVLASEPYTQLTGKKMRTWRAALREYRAFVTSQHRHEP